ncbi:uncharacterized protein LOC114364014 [Ostrinia furnacalis]|uniref:uncharacterized protein LOC114364014 n=1 Tax=Ostrinia furnacalis TaxID=93504 RepID=UPI0010386CBE|nr:uncharacterized protein LOC114364014 [Ostrinia furnacalis]
MVFDTEFFISLIKSKVSIWNYKTPEYSNKIKRNKDWAFVCESMIPNFAEKNNKEKNAIAIKLQGRWKVLRDGFMRSIKNQTKKSGAKTKLYKYHKQLLFLKDTMTVKGWRDPGGAGTSNVQSEITPDEIPTKKPKRASKETSLETSSDNSNILIESLTKNVMEKLSSEEKDSDKQFLLCLLNDFKAIPADDKLDAKSDIINVIRYYKNKSSHQNEPQRNQPSPPDYFRRYTATQYSRNVANDSTQIQNSNSLQSMGSTHLSCNQQTPSQSISSPEMYEDIMIDVKPDTDLLV